MRRRARTPGGVLKADVVKTVRGWMLNLVVATDCAERAPTEGPAIGLDWGVSDFATIAIENGGYAVVPNPRYLAIEAEDLKAYSRKLCAAAKARKISARNLRKHRHSLARRHAKVAARRKDFLHKVTTRLAASHRMIVTEALTVRNMTASACGTVADPGRNVAQKAGLNRSILDTAPATFLNMLRYKAEEAGSEFLLAPTRKLKPSQRCPACGTLQKKRLNERIHTCSCGCRLGRDEAAARVVLDHGLACEAARQDHPAGTAGTSPHIG